MKVIYNNKELSNNTRKYTTLVNKPSINGVVLDGNISLDELHLYNKNEVEKKLSEIQQMFLVSSLPSDLVPSCMYYVGPDEEGLYAVYIVDDTKHAIEIGTTQFGQYKGGPGVNVKTDNTININTDDNSILFDSEGRLKSSLDPDQLDAFTGATASTNGTRGLVPAPQIADRDKVLLGDGTWGSVDVIDAIYPVGALLVLNDNTLDPNNIFDDTTWVKVDSGYALWMKSGATAGTKLSSQAPTIRGPYMQYQGGSNGASLLSTDHSYSSDGCLKVTYSTLFGTVYGATANRCQQWVPGIDFSRNNKIYGASDEVQPSAFKVCIWQRTA